MSCSSGARCAPPELKTLLPANMIYKHLAALRPDTICSWNFRQRQDTSKQLTKHCYQLSLLPRIRFLNLMSSNLSADSWARESNSASLATARITCPTQAQ